MADITSIILHYNRPENVPLWLEGIRKQSVKSEVWVWDNSGNFPNEFKQHIDVYIKSDRNFNCQPRFLMGGFAKTEYIFNQDDDLAIEDPTLFEKLLDTARKNPNDFIGWNGRLFSPDVNWEQAYSFPGKGWCDDVDMKDLDMINVGVSFFRTALINQLPINPFKNDVISVTENEYKYGDDMFVSKCLADKRITSYMRKAFKYLNEYEGRGCALSKQSEHMIIRNELCRRYWNK